MNECLDVVILHFYTFIRWSAYNECRKCVHQPICLHVSSPKLFKKFWWKLILEFMPELSGKCIQSHQTTIHCQRNTTNADLINSDYSFYLGHFSISYILTELFLYTIHYIHCWLALPTVVFINGCQDEWYIQNYKECIWKSCELFILYCFCFM
jgi:hypothetical protein